MPIGASYGGGFLPSSVTGMGMGMGLPSKDPAAGMYGGGGLSRVGGLVGGAGGNMPNLPPDFVMPTSMGGLPPGIPPVQGPGSLLGNIPASAPPPPMNRKPVPSVEGAGPYGGIMGGQDIKRNRPTRNPSIPTGGIDPRPAQGDLMRGIRGKGGMSMF